jgi:hypothetical protein
MLSAIGYQSGGAPDPAVQFRIAVLFGPVVGSIFVLSGLVFYFVAAKKRDS